MLVHPQLRSLRRRQQGSALMLVFGLIAILTYLIFSTMRVVVNDVEYSMAQKKGFRCLCLAESGLNLAMNPVVQRTDIALLQQSFGEDGYESFKVSIRGEGGRLNINALLNSTNPDKDLLRQIFRKWGMTDEKEQDTLIDRLIDWVDTDEGRQEYGMEKEQYEELGILGYPFDRPFYCLDELLLVPGFDTIAALKRNWRDFFTVYSQGKLDLNEATEEMLELVCDTTPENAREFVESRYGDDNIEDTKDDYRYSDVTSALAMIAVGSGGMNNSGDFEAQTQQRVTVNDSTTRIESTGTVGDFRRRIIVVVRSRQGQPQILTREELPL
ncbi:MAG: general secretion pathway protein GspK [Verrucomicrobiales bacterium]|nr:general secretion pathway protein GspK [Verrucomicrobiales bacterium]